MQKKLSGLALASLLASSSLWAAAATSSAKEDTVIVAGGQIASANLEHQKQCTLLGGEDVTNNFNITLSGNAKDGVVCKLNSDQTPVTKPLKDVNNPEVSLAVPSKNKITDRHFISNGYATVSAPSGRVRYGYLFEAIGYTDYYNLVTPYIYSQLGVDADNCYFYASGVYYALSARIVLKTTCNAYAYGAVSSHMEASINHGPWIVDPWDYLSKLNYLLGLCARILKISATLLSGYTAFICGKIPKINPL